MSTIECYACSVAAGGHAAVRHAPPECFYACPTCQVNAAIHGGPCKSCEHEIMSERQECPVKSCPECASKNVGYEYGDNGEMWIECEDCYWVSNP